MKTMKPFALFIIAVAAALVITGCSLTQSSDQQQQAQQETLLKEGSAALGMPAIKNFREKRILKDILELRDQDGLTTYTYVFSEQTGKLRFLGETVGYGIPYSTQYSNPEKAEWISNHGYMTLPQADPNGLFTPAAADGTWVLLKDKHSNAVKPIYIEPRIIVSPFPLDE